ncbi:MAG: hypothetical protein ONB37_19170 [candidate division KSB1 bacterium]|nr:hypothetical protein [candidate division KSB1 bacterium]
MTAEVTIQAGICGFNTQVRSTSEDEQMVTLKIDSDCDKIKQLAKTIEGKNPLDGYQELMVSQILSAAAEQLKGGCAGCVVPAGIFKAMQVAAGLALPKDIEIKINRS